MELLSYEYQSIGDNSNLLATGTFTIMIIVIVLVISAIVTIYILKKKMKRQNDVIMRNLLR